MPPKKEGSARDYMTWAGWFVRPDDDAFQTLPKWRQLQIEKALEIRTAGKTPGIEIYTRPEAPVLEQPIATWFKYSVPDIDLTVIRQLAVGRGSAEVKQILETLEPKLLITKLLEECTLHGRGSTLRGTKPSGIYSYVWRMARYHSGEDSHISALADIDLYDGIYTSTGLLIDSGSIQEIALHLEAKGKELVQYIGSNPYIADNRWKTLGEK